MNNISVEMLWIMVMDIRGFDVESSGLCNTGSLLSASQKW